MSPPPNDQNKKKDITTASGPLNLLRPFLLLSYSAIYIFPTIIHLVCSFQWGAFFSFAEFKEHWFSRFWAFFGPKSRDFAAPVVLPLLERNATGVCLDIGPGTGQWLSVFGRAHNPTITKIYGVEPNRGMHALLRQQAAEAGLSDVYEVIGCGAQELKTRGGIAPGSIDTIITVQSLCSIPTPQVIIRELYPLLKPGGKWLMYEHVKTKYQSSFVGYWQKAINLIWPHFFGGCDICRPTDEWILQAGEWEDVNIVTGEGEGPYDTIPHVSGSLTKKRFEKLN
ncbi:S-adenosyl-L-methionine-dependent methyltransferase [Sphaerulina musiva SO2202]|uniref:S-adenosyl-L-methionine-dependent methyltransferase n=1 Tax=Sphaerulina musiva (strain SO2202) TaxID=692275 RepID=M3DBA0_SPHMS|nr:S-adenosyl-L-methionine-dependent methyltransferase [Sphaerulina musiva SO2202]EMF15340.1 S-adenosyl-L-methionine-dependent methyltransferase [Sphaerulina musiva SO2202]